MIYELGDEPDEAADFVSVPPGIYVCTVAEVTDARTRGGDVRWSMRLVVAEGEFRGRIAAWDSLVFSERGRHRARHVLGSLGLPNRGRIELEPEDLVGRRALVEVRPAEYEHPDTGRRVRRNEVPYDGFQPLPDADDDAPPRSPGGAALPRRTAVLDDEVPPF